MDNAPQAQRSRPSRRVLVTGGAGFIGSHLVELLVERGDDVTVVDNLSTGRVSNLGAARGRLALVEEDLADALEGLGAGAEPFDEIYHLAAAVGVDLVLRDPIGSIETNVRRTGDVLRYAERAGGVPTLIASSSEVYGKPDHDVFSEEDDVVYGPTTVTRWLYACSKAIDEHLGLAYHREGRAPGVAVRFFNTVGPRQVGEYGMVLPRFVQAALAGEPLRVHGDGSQSRCFCDVRDVVTALPRLLGDRECRGKVFNVGSDRPITIGALAALVIRTLGSDSAIEFVPYDEAYPEGFEDLRRRRPDLRRIRDAIGFEPAIPLEQTVRDVAAHLQAADSGSRAATGAGGGR